MTWFAFSTLLPYRAPETIWDQKDWVIPWGSGRGEPAGAWVPLTLLSYPMSILRLIVSEK